MSAVRPGFGTAGISDLLDEAMRQVTAEDARIRPQLPAPPAGFAWVPVLEASDFDFRFRDELSLVLVYRLVAIP